MMKKNKRMKYILLNIAVFMSVISVWANTNQQFADSAVIYYNANEFEKAIVNYEKIVSSGEASAALYYNLGNAYYKAKQLPQAIVNFERAKLIDPTDEDIIFNLRLVKTQTVDKIKSIPVFFLNDWYNTLTSIMSTNNWAYLSVISFALSLAFLLIYFFARSVQLKKITFWSASVFLLVSLMSMASSYNQKKINFDRKYAIITNPSVNIKASPDDNSTSIFILHSGTKLQVLDQIQQWYKIKIEDGNTGWIKLEDVEKV